LAKRSLFQEHLSNISDKRLDSLEHLFERHAPKLETAFAEVWDAIKDDPQVERQGSAEKVQHLFEVWQRKRKNQARDELMELLKENSFVEFWGRTRKEGERTGVRAGFEDQGDEELAAADQVDVRQMSKKIDLQEINAVLKHDKRFQILSGNAAQRDEWIRSYLEGMSAHAMSVHQYHQH
jgi:hypothetical protein